MGSPIFFFPWPFTQFYLHPHPLELIIWENIAYLASDKRRAEAFASLKQTIGTHPEQILAAQRSALAAIGKAGILPDVSATSFNSHGAQCQHADFSVSAFSICKPALK